MSLKPTYNREGCNLLGCSISAKQQMTLGASGTQEANCAIWNELMQTNWYYFTTLVVDYITIKYMALCIRGCRAREASHSFSFHL